MRFTGHRLRAGIDDLMEDVQRLAGASRKFRPDLIRVWRQDMMRPMETVSIYAAKTRLAEPATRVRFGVLEGKVKLSADFDAPLPEDVQAGFEAR